MFYKSVTLFNPGITHKVLCKGMRNIIKGNEGTKNNL